ncbi:oligoendopeptidase F [Bacillus sp. JCM 19046]|nr:oligoendopeptidase F [Bacillus sp. JCM 19046]
MNLPKWDLTRIYNGEEEVNRESKRLSEMLGQLENRESLLSLKEWKDVATTISEIEAFDSLYYILLMEGEAQSVLTIVREHERSLKTKMKRVLNRQSKLYAKLSLDEQALFNEGLEGQFDVSRVISTTPSEAETTLFSLAGETKKSVELAINEMKKQLVVTNRLTGGKLSIAEANKIALHNSNEKSHETIVADLNQALEKQAPFFAIMYNQLIQTRIKESQYDKTNPLAKSLKSNGITNDTLKLMWKTVDQLIPALTSYIVKREDGKRVSWYDYMTRSKKVQVNIRFHEAVERMGDSLSAIDQRLGSFVHKALEQAVDATLHERKQGGFCAPFLTKGESRISLAYDESIDSVRRLAHELGHAWHFKQMECVNNLYFSDERFEMTSAETASIFFETIVIDSLVADERNKALRKQMLSWKIEQMVHYLMSIRSAFLFEEAVCQKRKDGPLITEELEQLSLSSQQEAFGAVFTGYERYKWIKQSHFFMAEFPFYNYSYTFGFLISQGLVELACKDAAFVNKFGLLLSETGKMPIKDLMLNHFQINLSEPAFWEVVVGKLLSEIKSWHDM